MARARVAGASRCFVFRDVKEAYESGAYSPYVESRQLVAPATGMPVVTVSMGFTYENLPAGLQILGPPYSEGVLIRLAYAYEQATRHRRPPEAFPELEDGSLRSSN